MIQLPSITAVVVAVSNTAKDRSELLVSVQCVCAESGIPLEQFQSHHRRHHGCIQY